MKLVRRDRDRNDERSLAVVLTDKGRALREDAEKVPIGIVDRLGVDVAELLDLHRRLSDLITAAKAATMPSA